jgi:hypothetical protein
LNYLQEIADAIQAEVPADQLPSEDASTLFRIYAVLALAKGVGVTAEDVHNAWTAWMTASNPTHESVEPFDRLSRKVQSDDEPFVKAIRTVASRLQPRT